VILRPPGLANVGRVAKIAFEDPIHYCKWAARQIKGHPELVSELLRYCRPGIDQVKSIQEVVQSLCTHTACFNEPVIADCLRSADLWFGNCRRVPQTISIVSPIENQGANNHFLSFCLEQIFAQIQSAQFDGLIPVAIVVDEFGAYPRMESVRLAFSSLRKFNSFIALAVNDYGTLVDTYGKQAAEGFLENAGMVQYMSTKSTSGCTHLSEMLGDIQVDSENIAITNPTPGSQGNPTVNRTHSKQRRRLLEPFEIAQLGSQEQIVKMSGVSRPILCSKRPYYETNLARKAARNPFFRKG
jgi:type IV secretory pathway TraG/TraD family ATPase VirD4